MLLPHSNVFIFLDGPQMQMLDVSTLFVNVSAFSEAFLKTSVHVSAFSEEGIREGRNIDKECADDVQHLHVRSI